ncbi:MAG: enoyl-CoA hydratase/isomerase family protein, partial [Bacteriovoracaceae bacterium]
LGLVPGIGGTYFLTRLIGYNKAIELTLTGKRIDSSWALKNGVLNETFENVEKLDHGIKELLDGLKKNSSLAMGYAKQALKSAYHNQLKDNLEHLSTYQGICQSHPDHLKRIGK